MRLVHSETPNKLMNSHQASQDEHFTLSFEGVIPYLVTPACLLSPPHSCIDMREVTEDLIKQFRKEPA